MSAPENPKRKSIPSSRSGGEGRRTIRQGWRARMTTAAANGITRIE